MHAPIVFIHGSGDNARIWRLQAEHFGPDQAYAIDLPGHGQRPDTLPSEVTILDYARCARAIISEELHLKRPIIAGHSLGGAIALTMGLEYPEALGGLILIGTGARLRVHPDLLRGAKEGSDETRLRLTELAFSPSNAASQAPTLLKEQPAPGANILYRDLAACNIFDCMERLAELRLPTLIICGTEDRLTPVKYSQFLKNALPHATLAIIPEAGHYVMREQPGAVNEVIENWLQTLEEKG